MVPEKVDENEKQLKTSFERMTSNLLSIGKVAPRKRKEVEHLGDDGGDQSGSDMDMN